MRYQIWTCKDVLLAEHGEGSWIEEFWIPDEGVCFNAANEGTDEAPIAHAFFATMEERTVPAYRAPANDAKPVEVQIPRRIVDQAVAIAKQRREMDARQEKLGREWTEALRIRPSWELDSESEDLDAPIDKKQ
jgi:hypothetical protein